MLSPVLVTAPTAQPITLDEAKLHLRVDGDDENLEISTIVLAAVSHLDGYAGILGRCLMPQTWSQEYETPTIDLVLPLGPVSAVVSVTGGFTGFRLLKDGRGYFLRLNSGESWPSFPLVVEFTAGSVAPPPDLKAAMLLHIGTLYEFRETLAERVTPTMQYDSLISKYRMNCV
jgi:hypothetical protein